MSILSKLLTKWKIDKIEDLSQEERVVYDNYNKILSGKNEVTIDSLKEFMRAQIKIIEHKFADGETKNDLYFKACLHVYLNLLKVIEAPEAERESTELHLNQLLNT